MSSEALTSGGALETFYGGYAQGGGGVSHGSKTHKSKPESALVRYTQETYSRAKSDLMKKIAEGLKHLPNQKDLHTKSPEKMAEAFGQIASMLEGKKANGPHQETLVSAMTSAINSAYSSPMISTDGTLQQRARSIAEVLNSLNVGLNMEFANVAGEIKTITSNLATLKDAMTAAQQRMLEVADDGLPDGTKMQLDQIRELFDALSTEQSRQLGILTNLIESQMSSGQTMLADLVRDSGNLGTALSELRGDADEGQFGTLLAGMLSGASRTGYALEQVRKALNKIGMSMDDYENTQGMSELTDRIVKKLESKAGKLSAKALDEFIAIRDILKQNESIRADIIERLNERKRKQGGGSHGKGGAAGGYDQEIRGRNKTSQSLKSRLNRQDKARELLLQQFDRFFKSNYKKIIIALSKISKSVLAGKVDKDDKLIMFMQAVERLPIVHVKKLGIYLTGLNISSSAKTKRDQFINKLQDLVTASEQFKTAEFADVARAAKEQLELPKKFDDKFLDAIITPDIPDPALEIHRGRLVGGAGGDEFGDMVRDGDDMGSGMGSGMGGADGDSDNEDSSGLDSKHEDSGSGSGLDATFDSEDKSHTQGDMDAVLTADNKAVDAFVDVGGGGESNAVYYSIEKVKDELQHAINISGIASRMRMTAEMRSENDTEYQKVLGEAAAELINKFEGEYSEEIKDLNTEYKIDLTADYPNFTTGQAIQSFKARLEALKAAELAGGGVPATVEAKFNPKLAAADSMCEAWVELGKEIAKQKRDCRKQMVEVAQNMDIYFHEFIKAAGKQHPHETATVQALLQGTNLIRKWFNEASSSNISELFQHFPAVFQNGLGMRSQVPSPPKNARDRKAFLSLVATTPVDDAASVYAGNPFLAVLPKDSAAYNELKAKIARSINGIHAFKNIVQVFTHIGDNSTGSSLMTNKNLFMNAANMFKIITEYVVCSCIANDFRENALKDQTEMKSGASYTFTSKFTADADAVRVHRSEIPECLRENVITGTNHGRITNIMSGVTNEVATGYEKVIVEADGATLPIDAPVRYKLGVAMAGLPDAADKDMLLTGYRNSYKETDDLLYLTIKTMLAKILVAVGKFTLFQRPINNYPAVGPLRMILGGGNMLNDSSVVVPRVHDYAMSAYVRLPLMMEFYRQIFVEDPVTATKYQISLVPDAAGPFADLFHYFFHQAKHIKDGEYSDSDVRIIITLVNEAIKRYTDKSDPSAAMLQGLIRDVSSKYGFIKTTELTQYNERLDTDRKAEISDDVNEADDDEFDILGEENAGYPRMAPSSKYVKYAAFDRAKASVFSEDVTLAMTNMRDKIAEYLQVEGKDREDGALRAGAANRNYWERYQPTQYTLAPLIENAKEEAKSGSAEDKFYAVAKLIRSVGKQNDISKNHLLMYMDLVKFPLNMLQSIKEILERSIGRLQVYNPKYAFTNKAALSAGTLGLDQATQYTEVYDDAKFASADPAAAELERNGEVLAYSLFSELRFIGDDLHGLIKIQFAEKGSIFIDFSRLKELVFNMLSGVKYSIDKMRVLLGAEFVDEDEIKYHNLEESLKSKMLTDRDNTDVDRINIDINSALKWLRSKNVSMGDWMRNRILYGEGKTADNDILTRNGNERKFPFNLLPIMDNGVGGRPQNNQEKQLYTELANAVSGSQYQQTLGPFLTKLRLLKNIDGLLTQVITEINSDFNALTGGGRINFEDFTIELNASASQLIKLKDKVKTIETTNSVLMEAESKLNDAIIYLGNSVRNFKAFIQNFSKPISPINPDNQRLNPNANVEKNEFKGKDIATLGIMLELKSGEYSSTANNNEIDALLNTADRQYDAETKEVRDAYETKMKAFLETRPNIYSVNTVSLSSQADSELPNGTGLYLKYNRLLAAVVGKFYDNVTGKFYLPLVKSLAEGVLSPGVRDGNAINDTRSLEDKPDPPLNAVLCAGLARAIRNVVVLGEDTTTGPADGSLLGGSVNVVGVNDMSQVPESIRAEMRAAIPLIVSATRYLIHEIRFFQKWIDESKIKVDVTTPKNVAPADALGKDGLYRGFVAVGAAADNDAKVYLSNLLSNLAPAAEGLLQTLTDTYRQLADVPMYFETYKGSVSEYKSRNGESQMVPLAMTMSGMSNPDAAYWYGNAVGSPNHKYNHALRGIMLPNSPLKMENAPGLAELFKSYNQSVNATFSFSEADLRDCSAANLLAARFLVDYKVNKKYICDGRGAEITRSWENQSSLDSIDKTISLLESSKRSRVISQITRDVYESKELRKRTGNVERKKAISYNLFEVGPPLDVLALAKSVPFTHLVNAAWTYDSMVKEMMGCADDTINSAGSLAYQLMVNPLKKLNYNQFYVFYKQLMRGDSMFGGGFAVPKLLSDLYNHVHFGSVYVGWDSTGAPQDRITGLALPAAGFIGPVDDNMLDPLGPIPGMMALRYSTNLRLNNRRLASDLDNAAGTVGEMIGNENKTLIVSPAGNNSKPTYIKVHPGILVQLQVLGFERFNTKLVRFINFTVLNQMLIRDHVMKQVVLFRSPVVEAEQAAQKSFVQYIGNDFASEDDYF